MPTNLPPGRHPEVTLRFEMRQLATIRSAVRSPARPCAVFSQNEGVTTSCHMAFTAAIDIITQYTGTRIAVKTSLSLEVTRAVRMVRVPEQEVTE